MYARYGRSFAVWLAFSLSLIAQAVLSKAVSIQPDVTPGVIPFTVAEVTRTPDSSLAIKWASAGPSTVTIYASESPTDFTHARLIGRYGPRGSTIAAQAPGADRWYFELKPDRGAPLVVADRSLHLATAPNFRDAGGYRTSDGRWVRTGMLYRSDQLDRLSDADLATIARLSPAMVVDLRTDRERRQGMDRWPPSALHLVADVYADVDKSSGEDPYAQISSPDQAVELLQTANRRFVSLPSAKHGYGLLLTSIEASPGPLVYHCSAGKDRTGWATAVLLSILGVPHDVVMQDYLASNTYLVEKNRQRLLQMGSSATRLEPVFWVKESYLEAAFREADADYGSFERYLHDGLGLGEPTLAALRDRYLVGESQNPTPRDAAR
jgi:protein-tyrosine phosphatase